jgi:Icc-related predicted phosphoesterase
MRILAFSDVIKREGYEELLGKFQPDIITLPGDLTSDGFASFWNEAIEQIPKFQKEKNQLMEKFGVIQISKNFYRCTKDQSPQEWFNILESLRDKYQNTKEFLKIRKRIHVDRFYRFLKCAGRKSKVLIVKGDHDDDFERDYIPERIDRIIGCKEISDKIIEMQGLHFLGLGFNETHYLKKLRPIIEKFKEKVDVVISHCEQDKLPLVSLLKPKIIIRGHFGSGKYLVNSIPSVFTMGVKYTIIELKDEKILKISQYIIGSDNKLRILEKGSCRPFFSKFSEFERYKWLKPFPEE